MTRQRVLVAVAVWLAVVAGVSTLVWVVISRAGDDLEASGRTVVSTTPEAGRTGAGGAGRSPARRPPRSSAGSPSAAPSSPTPTAPAPTSTPSSPTSSPTSSTTSSPSVSPSPSPSSPDPPTAPPPAARRTWQGAAGTVVVACDAGRVRLVSAQPATGFHAEVKPEDGALAVEFEGREDRSGAGVTVVARCEAGVPVFSTEGTGSSESSDD